MKIELPDHIKCHPVVYVSYKSSHKKQPLETAFSIKSRSKPIQADEVEEYDFEAILKHRKRGRGYQFLTVMKRTNLCC